MKISFFLMLVSCLSVSANAFGQYKVSLDVKDASVMELFLEIQKKTDLFFVFNAADLESFSNVTVKAHEEEVEAVLNRVFRHSSLQFIYEGDVIVVTPRVQQPDRVSLTGQVTARDGRPLAGVTVMVAGTTIGTSTDVDGRFTIAFIRTAQSALEFSFLGMKKQIIPYTGQTTLRVVMEDEVAQMDQVVVTGYQTIAREKVTGAVSTITSEELGERYTPNLLDNLEGRVAGLMTYNGGMQIRGTGSIYAERNPLLVIDGMPVEGSIEDLNPYDIESVTVLKDAAAAAIYGARASNGIIVVTTKKAREIGKVDVDVSMNFTVYDKRNLDYHDNFYMNPREQVEMEMKTWQNLYFDDPTTSANAISGTESNIASGYYGSITPVRYAYYQLAKGDITQSQFDALMEQYKNNNFAKEYSDNILKKRFLQQYNVAIRNRTDNFNSNLVLNYRHDNTGTIQAFNNRFSAFYKGGYDMTKWLTINFGAEMGFEKSKESNSSYTSNPFNVPAYMSLLNDDGSYNYYSASLSNIYHTQWEDESGLKFNGFNHLNEIENGYDEASIKRLSARLQSELVFKIIDGLTVNAMFIYEADRINESSYSHEDSYLMRMMQNAYTVKISEGSFNYLIPENGGKLATTDTRGDYWTARGQVNFTRTFASKHSIDFLAGLEFRQTLSKGTNGLLMGYSDQLQSHSTLSIDYPYLESLTYGTFYGTNYPVRQFFFTPYMSSAVSPVREQMHRFGSGYANVTYTYNSRYNLFGSFRKDYADKYGADTKYRGKPLWSAGASWNVEREEFLSEISWVDILKLRTSYGVTGNMHMTSTSYLTATTGTINSVTGLPISVVSSPANPELTWEKTATINIGVDFALLGNRIRGSIDWYNKKGTDIFANKLLEDSKGFASMAMNAADLKNNGIELMLAADWFRARNPRGFSWTTSATFAYNKNEITNVDTPATRAYELVETPYKVGYPVSAIFSYRYAGIDEDGHEYLYWKGDASGLAEDVKVTSVWSNSPNIPEILVFSGQTDPKYSIGMENKFRFQNFSLNVMMVYYGGHMMRMRQIGKGAKNSLPYGTIDIAYLNSWAPENTDTNVPGYGQYGGSSTSTEYQSLDIFVKSGDFIKIRNIVFGYDVPRELLSKLGLSRAVLNFQIDNPKALYIANKHGLDPETGGIRRQTSYIFGLNISF